MGRVFEGIINAAGMPMVIAEMIVKRCSLEFGDETVR
jgi:hypothetical protein